VLFAIGCIGESGPYKTHRNPSADSFVLEHPKTEFSYNRAA
jgi:hypothetical protein